MKLKALLLLIIAGLVGYALGTENGRRQRDELIRRIRRQDSVGEALEAAEGVADDIVDAASSAADEAASAVGDIAGSSQP